MRCSDSYSEEEAIAYAKTNQDVKEFIENEYIWEVGFEAQPVKDVLFVIRFKPDGTVISKGLNQI